MNSIIKMHEEIESDDPLTLHVLHHKATLCSPYHKLWLSISLMRAGTAAAYPHRSAVKADCWMSSDLQGSGMSFPKVPLGLNFGQHREIPVKVVSERKGQVSQKWLQPRCSLSKPSEIKSNRPVAVSEGESTHCWVGAPVIRQGEQHGHWGLNFDHD